MCHPIVREWQACPPSTPVPAPTPAPTPPPSLPEILQIITFITHTTNNASSTLTSAAFQGLSTVVSGEAVINGTLTMTQFVFLAMMKNLLNGTKSVAAPTSLPTNFGAINCNQEGWGLCLSCTPAGVNPKIRKGTTITITRLPEPPDISLSRCLFSFLCANPRPGTSAQTVEGVEDEIQVNQLTVDVDGRNPGTFSDTNYKDTARHHRF
ncbi:hypothetical protein HO133_007345 [Letharia lupina]|uniref:Uncharacterized protein n=1 Tax=Letharia lupina TaxID=560253 RepID=A0A8H6KYK5_9LECA|nr:uncharacterized protein HO133_007345 [Letharia lupina]KAF6229229.1 hypothetical protein HO133_007345 [Letharia lupina]